jgi:hypothetical protein
LSEIVFFGLAAYGLTQILVYSKIFEKIRPSSYFFHCPMCVGFWVGVVLMFLGPYTELFTFDVSVVNALLLGSISSATSYALCMLIGDGGFQYEYRKKRVMDAKVDAQTSNQLLQG